MSDVSVAFGSKGFQSELDSGLRSARNKPLPDCFPYDDPLRKNEEKRRAISPAMLQEELKKESTMNMIGRSSAGLNNRPAEMQVLGRQQVLQDNEQRNFINLGELKLGEMTFSEETDVKGEGLRGESTKILEHYLMPNSEKDEDYESNDFEPTPIRQIANISHPKQLESEVLSPKEEFKNPGLVKQKSMRPVVNRMSVGTSSWNDQETVNDEFEPIYKNSAKQQQLPIYMQRSGTEKNRNSEAAALAGPLYALGNSSITAFDVA